MKRSDIIASCAAAISLVSLLVSYVGYESQKKAAELSTLPAVSIYERYEVPIRDMDSDQKITTLKWKIENTGQGPAFIHSAVIVVNDSERYEMDSNAGWESIQLKLNQVLGKNEIYAFNNDPISCPYAVKAGAEWSLFSISYKGDLTQEINNDRGVDLAICYCSSHGECFYEGTKEGLISCPTTEINPELLLRGQGCGEA